jgi:riboflavin synthase
MFTGLIESIGEVVDVSATPSGSRLTVATTLTSELVAGDSLAVNGVCLTVVSAAGGRVSMDVSPETLRVTTLGGLTRGALVNLERPLRMDARLGGHFVQGHVDATGSIAEVRKEGDSHLIAVTFPPDLRPCIVRKGSIAVDGISLTVARVDNDRFDMQIIPYTWQHTHLHVVRAGDAVNLETDILGKYVVRAFELRERESPKLQMASIHIEEEHR